MLNRQFLLAIIFLLGCCALNAQENFRPAYLFSSSGDTLEGFIDYRGDEKMGKVCKFRPLQSEQISRFSPEEIKGFRFKDSKYFVSYFFEEEWVFLEYLMKGEASIYYLRKGQQNYYFLQIGGSELKRIPYEEGFVEKSSKPKGGGASSSSGDTYFYRSTLHTGMLTYHLQAAPDLKKKIDKIVIPGHNNLIKLAKDYHVAVSPDEPYTIFEEGVPFVRIFPEFNLGILNFDQPAVIGPPEEETYFQGGIILHCWLPRLNEKFFLRTGILLSPLSFDEGDRLFAKIPIQLEYIYPRGALRPRLSYGFNFYYPGFRSVSVSPGLALHTKSAGMFVLNAEPEFIPRELIIPSSLFNYSISLGWTLTLGNRPFSR
ncbi:MAG: hypothetical protein AAFY71_08845 [Bacteroidota bacterium]